MSVGRCGLSNDVGIGTRMKVALLGFTVDEATYDEIARGDSVLPAQTFNFSWALVDALVVGGGCAVSLMSVAPVSDWPQNRRVVWGRAQISRGSVAGEMLPFINLPVLKHLTRFFACLIYGLPAIRKTGTEMLIIHGVHSPFLWFAALIRKMRLAKVVVVLTDPPGVVLRTDGHARRALKRLDIEVARRALRRVDGTIVLSKALEQDFAPRRPSLLMEGISRDLGLPDRTDSRPGRTIVIYAGGLYAEYGALDLAKAVHESDLNVELRMFGRGPAAQEIAALSKRDPRIIAPRALSRDDIVREYASASVLVQPRPADQTFVPYSFPSKLLEYMASGVPVISTRLPSIPADYEPFALWANGSGPTAIRAALHRFVQMSHAERRSLGAAARDYVMLEKSALAQGKRIAKFLAEL